MNKAISVLLADSHNMCREGLSCLLKNDKRFNVAGETNNGNDTLKFFQKAKPDVVLLDFKLPGLTLNDSVRQIREENRKSQVIVMGENLKTDQIREAVSAGALGYISPTASFADLKEAIERVYKGERYLSDDPMNALIKDFISGNNNQTQPKSLASLTRREKEVFKLMASGNDPENIADMLNISIKTYYKHRINLMDKLGIRNMAQLTRFAYDSGLVEVEEAY